jgi:hypothetical protein
MELYLQSLHVFIRLHSVVLTYRNSVSFYLGCLLLLNFAHWCCSDDGDLLSVGAMFQSWLSCLVIFLNLSRRVLSHFLEMDHYRLLPNPCLCIIHGHLPTSVVDLVV